MGVSVGCGNRSDAGKVSSTLGVTTTFHKFEKCVTS
jgi:hypothetical protein